MKRISIQWVRRATEDELHVAAEAIDAEMERRNRMRIPRGRCRSTYLADRVRGRRMARRRAA